MSKQIWQSESWQGNWYSWWRSGKHWQANSNDWQIGTWQTKINIEPMKVVVNTKKGEEIGKLTRAQKRKEAKTLASASIVPEKETRADSIFEVASLTSNSSTPFSTQRCVASPLRIGIDSGCEHRRIQIRLQCYWSRAAKDPVFMWRTEWCLAGEGPCWGPFSRVRKARPSSSGLRRRQIVHPVKRLELNQRRPTMSSKIRRVWCRRRRCRQNFCFTSTRWSRRSSAFVNGILVLSGQSFRTYGGDWQQ